MTVDSNLVTLTKFSSFHSLHIHHDDRIKPNASKILVYGTRTDSIKIALFLQHLSSNHIKFLSDTCPNNGCFIVTLVQL